MPLRFAEFALDVGQRRLFRHDADVALGPKAFDLLRLLLSERPRVLSKDEIFAALWPDTFVTENNLATVVRDLRAALGDDAREPRFIRTVHTVGYAFVGEAVDEGGAAPTAGTASRWRLIYQQHELSLLEGDNVLGRSGADVIVIDSPTVSRHHARLTVRGDEATCADLGSKNGTWVAGQPVTSPTAARDGDELRLGSVVLVLRKSGSARSTETVERGE